MQKFTFWLQNVIHNQNFNKEPSNKLSDYCVNKLLMINVAMMCLW